MSERQVCHHCGHLMECKPMHRGVECVNSCKTCEAYYRQNGFSPLVRLTNPKRKEQDNQPRLFDWPQVPKGSPRYKGQNW